MRPGSMADGAALYAYFKSEQAAIREDIAGVGSVGATEQLDSVQHSENKIELLAEEVELADFSISPHDRSLYTGGLRDLYEALEEARSKIRRVGERRRFVFRTEKNESALSVNDAIHLYPLPDKGPAASELHDHLNAKLALPSSALTAQTMRVADIHSCVVDLRDKAASGRFASVTLTAIHHSLVVLGEVDGPVLMTNMHASTIILAGCRQCRVHESQGTRIYLSCQSRPVTEECMEMVFSSVPSALRIGEQRIWDQVDDFDNIHGAPANFTLDGTPPSIDWSAILQMNDAREILACIQR